MASEDGDVRPEPPEGFEIGTVGDAVVDDSKTYTKWVTDEETGKAYWFELKEDVPLRKKNEILEGNVTVVQGPDGDPTEHLGSGYYDDMLEYMVVDWHGAHEEDAPSIRTFLSKVTEVFGQLQEEVPSPFGRGETDRGK